MNSSNTTRHHGQNRRRERPGSRTRRTIARKSNIRHDYNEGYSDSRDVNPRPPLYQDFDQCWQRWKLREAEAEAHTYLAPNQIFREPSTN